MAEQNITRTLRILNASGTGVLEWNFEKNILHLCPSFLSILNEPIRQHNSNLSFFWRRLHKQDQEVILSSVQKHIETSTPIDTEFRLRAREKGYIWVRAQGYVETDNDSHPALLTVVITDITRQHLISAELKLSEQRLQHASECANVSLWEIKAKHHCNGVERHFWWSDSLYSILGYNKEELLQTEEQIYQIMYAKDLEYIKDYMGSILQDNRTSIDLQFRLLHKTEGYLWFKCVGHREKLAEAYYMASGAIININDLKIAQHDAKIKNEKLEQTNEELEHFAYAASHDLKAPLRGLKNLANWISEDLKNPPDSIKKNLQLMNNRVERMENLLSDILAYSRAGRRNKEPEQINLQSLIEEIWDCARPPRGFQLHLDLQNPTLTLSKTLLEQTLSNLISNSIKHHDRETGEVTISYHINSTHHCFSVTDDGPGIDLQFQDKIFQIFQTLRPRDEVEGSGVGLAIVKRNITSSGGIVWLDTLQEQRGACFNFTLPRLESRIAAERKSLGLFDNEP